MSTSLIVVTVILLVLTVAAVFIYLVATGRKKLEILKKQTLDRATRTEAEVLSIAEAEGGYEYGTTRKIGLRLKLNVRHPARGTYEASTHWLVSEILIPQVQPAKILPVLVNADDPARVYPNTDGIEFADWILKGI
ncbi:MAG TPA: hypothetical protein VIL74_11190 [Pyrinomonadaceae bacterium]|jgi:hypothetical protein